MKKSKKGEAKFFCESCGSEVPGRARVCPVCGKFFASVRCPKCGRTGASEDFKNGCPTCGYAVNPLGGNVASGNYDFGNLNGSKGKNNKSKGKSSIFSSLFGNKKQNSSNGDSSLPIWVYLVTLSVLVILVICLYSCL